MIRPLFRLATATTAATLVILLGVSLVAAGRSNLDAARAATARFHSIGQAEAAGYGQPPSPAPLHFCIDDQMGMGAMGFHFINGALLSGEEAGRVVPDKPEVLVYAPDARGKLHLAALEYVIFAADWAGSSAPTLFGQTFSYTPSPNRYDIPAFYSLHVWLWKDNPDDLFAPMNPDVSCN